MGAENIMKFLCQFGIILFVSFLGEVLYHLIPLSIPASVYGMMILFLALCTGFVKLDQVKETAGFLIDIMPIMFMPAAVGLLESWSFLAPVWASVFAITIITTIIVMAVTGRVAQHILWRKE